VEGWLSRNLVYASGDNNNKYANLALVKYSIQILPESGRYDSEFVVRKIWDRDGGKRQMPLAKECLTEKLTFGGLEELDGVVGMIRNWEPRIVASSTCGAVNDCLVRTVHKANMSVSVVKVTLD